MQVFITLEKNGEQERVVGGCYTLGIRPRLSNSDRGANRGVEVSATESCIISTSVHSYTHLSACPPTRPKWARLSGRRLPTPAVVVLSLVLEN